MISNKIKSYLQNNDLEIFDTKISDNQIQFQQTRKEFEGDITLVCFPFSKILKTSPEKIGEKLGSILKSNIKFITTFNVVKGFLNIVISDEYWLNELQHIVSQQSQYGINTKKTEKSYMVEYSSPNTNKPLHLGHLRNIFLGESLSNILQANGHNVIRTQIINDRGIHICKSMIAWKKYAPLHNGIKETPESIGMKGDKFVGKYYVKYDTELTKESIKLAKCWQKNNYRGIETELAKKTNFFLNLLTNKDLANKEIKNTKDKIKSIVSQKTELAKEVNNMLLKWEEKDPETYDLWKKMNQWFYEGVEVSYKKMNVKFDKLYYESDTYILGKENIIDGLKKGVFYKKEDGSVWIDLSNEGLDEKLVLRANGTAVYMTQDIGTAIKRFKDYPNLNGITYTVGNEQDYHFKVLFLILKKLGYQWANECHHLSYGMIDLPKGMGKMKSREGTVVEADELMNEVINEAKLMTSEKGHIDNMSNIEKDKLCEKIGLGGLKYFLLKVDPKKRMTFDPTSSVELQGNTAPFIQYSYARISSILSNIKKIPNIKISCKINLKEKNLIKLMSQFPEIIKEAAEEQSPALVANYTYELAKNFNQFYQDFRILGEKDTDKKNYRINICKGISNIIKNSMNLLGIEVPSKM